MFEEGQNFLLDLYGLLFYFLGFSWWWEDSLNLKVNGENNRLGG